MVPDEETTTEPGIFSYDPRKGMDIRSRDGNYTAHIDLRGQFRFTHSNDEDGDSEDEFEVTRARFKMGGQIYRKWLTYYTEYDFPSTRLLDLRFTVSPDEALQLRIGQWKAPYNRERVDSSGNQQFVERSIVNEFFTLDRQQGVALFGRLWEGRAGDSWYNLGVFAGSGRGAEVHVGARPMVMGRWQWNFLKRDLGFSQSDIAYRDKPAASLSLAAANWRGAFTAFSSAGGGELPGFAPGDDDRYDVSQAMLEAAYQHRGVSFQAEIHWKQVRDTEANTRTQLIGGYAQAGIFPHTFWSSIPRPLELAARYAQVDPSRHQANDAQREVILAANWFFIGHRNKLTVDFSWVNDDAAAPDGREKHRLRMQWDISI